MVHGGTNFGFYSGANTGAGASDYQPDITSYDYVCTSELFVGITDAYTARAISISIPEITLG